MLGPPSALMPKQASLSGSSVPPDGPLEGHLFWDFASRILFGTARNFLFHLILSHYIFS